MTETYTTELASWAAIVGTTLPLAIAVISQSGWGTRTRSLLTAGLSVLAAIGTVHFANPGGLEAAPLVITTAAILTLAGSTYRTFWKPSGVAPAINEATNVL